MTTLREAFSTELVAMMLDENQMLRATLKMDGPPQANQPQAGWKLVPIEPTPEMLFAGHMKIDFDRSEQNTYEMSHESQRGPEGVGTTIEQDMRDCWSAMIAAAPQANQPQAGWKPIETAPKDMASRLYFVKGFVVQGFVDATGQLNSQNDRYQWQKMVAKPTHWMPLPQAPEAK